MVTVSSLVEFLLSLLRDPEARAEFEQNPEAVLARNGLDGLCMTDVTDAEPLLADRSGVQASANGSVANGHVVESGGNGPIQEITHVTNNYEVDRSVAPDEPDVYNVNHVDDRDQIINVDDRDTTTIQAAGDVNIDDSFNQDNDASIVNDSYNQDNDGLDNKGGTIDDSNAGGGGSINLGNDAGSVADESEDSAGEPEEEMPPEATLTSEGSTSETIDVEEGSGETQLSSDEGTSEQTLQASTVDDTEQDQMVDSA